MERPGKTEVVTGREPEEEEKDGGGWVVVETQRKTREVLTRKEESRTGRIKRMYPALSKHMPVEVLVRHEETETARGGGGKNSEGKRCQVR